MATQEGSVSRRRFVTGGIAEVVTRLTHPAHPTEQQAPTTLATRRDVVGLSEVPVGAALGMTALDAALPSSKASLADGQSITVVPLDQDPLYRPLDTLKDADDPLSVEEMRSLAAIQACTIARLETENDQLKGITAAQDKTIADLRGRLGTVVEETVDQKATVIQQRGEIAQLRKKLRSGTRPRVEIKFGTAIPRRDFLWFTAAGLATVAVGGSVFARRTGYGSGSSQGANMASDGVKNGIRGVDAHAPEIIEDGIIPGPFLTKLKNMNIFVDLEEINKYADKTGILVSGVTVMYTDGKLPQTIGIDRHGGDPIRGIVKNIDGFDFLHLQLHPTDAPAFVTFNTGSHISPNPYSEPVQIRAKTPDYLITDPNDRKRVFYDDAAAPEWKLREIHEFLKEFDFLGISPNLAIRKKYGTLIETSPQTTTPPALDAEISLDAKLFDDEHWKDILSYEIGKYFYRQAVMSGDGMMTKAVGELQSRIADSTLSYHLSTNMRNGEGVYDKALPTVYDEVLNPESYDPSLGGLADFSMNAEHAAGNLLLLLMNPAYASEMTSRYKKLYYYDEFPDTIDITHSDRAVASTVLYPLYGMYTLRREQAPKQFLEALNNLGVMYNLTIPSFKEYSPIDYLTSPGPLARING